MLPSKIAVLFNKPICIELDPLEPDGRPEHPDSTEIPKILEECRMDGFDERAIVVLANRYSSYYSDPKNWGVVTDMKSWHRHVNPVPYRPIGVKWVGGQPGMTSYYWPEDLILIHAAISHKVVRMLVEENP